MKLPHIGKSHRKIYYGQESFHHPAKMHIELARWIIDKYSKVGDTVLDPMAGIGTSVIEAQLLNRIPYAIELESRWAKLIASASNSMNKGVVLPMTPVNVVRGDATKATSYDPVPETDLIILSPPYGIQLSGGGIAKKQRPGGLTPYDTEKDNKNNIGNYLLESKEYNRSMGEVYKHCYEKAKSMSYMVTVTKNYYWKGEYKRLDMMTNALGVAKGWEFIDYHTFQLPYLSMWQKMNMKKFPERKVIDHEIVLVFQKTN